MKDQILKGTSARDQQTLTQTPTKKNGNPFVDSSFLVFTFIALIGGGLCYLRGEEEFFRGLDASLSMFLEIAPQITAGFLLAAFTQVLIPKEFIRKWVGEESGLKGIVIASLAGSLTPGGPIASFPIVAALYSMGADFGSLVAYLTAWELLGVQRILIWEIPLLGMRFVAIRVVVSLLCPVIAGLMARQLVIHFSDLRPGGEWNH